MRKRRRKKRRSKHLSRHLTQDDRVHQIREGESSTTGKIERVTSSRSNAYVPEPTKSLRTISESSKPADWSEMNHTRYMQQSVKSHQSGISLSVRNFYLERPLPSISGQADEDEYMEPVMPIPTMSAEHDRDKESGYYDSVYEGLPGGTVYDNANSKVAKEGSSIVHSTSSMRQESNVLKDESEDPVYLDLVDATLSSYL